MKNIQRRTVRCFAAAFVSCVSVGALAAPASADPAPLEVYRGGDLKARATYNSADDRICVRVFNSAAGATAKAWVILPGGEVWSATATADGTLACQIVYEVDQRGFDGLQGNWGVTWTGPQGATETATGTVGNL